jgi:hypothetical protein
MVGGDDKVLKVFGAGRTEVFEINEEEQLIGCKLAGNKQANLRT